MTEREILIYNSNNIIKYISLIIKYISLII